MAASRNSHRCVVLFILLFFHSLISLCWCNDDVTLADLQTVVQQQAATIQQLSATVQALGAKVTSSDTTIHTLQTQLSAVQSRQNKNVGFTARGNGGSINIGEHGIVKFGSVVSNIGGGFNSGTGIFSAPFTGMYGFILHIRSDNVHPYIVVDLIKNSNTFLCATLAEGPQKDQFDKSSCAAVIQLNAGDQVYARRDGGDGTYLEENYLCSFVGFLINAD